MIDALSLEEMSVDVRGRTLLDDVSLRVAPGELVALVGPNGAGKTTLIRAVLGLSGGVSGSAKLAGRECSGLRGRERAAFAAWLPQQALVTEPITALELVSSARFRFDEPLSQSLSAAREALERLGASAFAGRPVTQLSGGEQQRVALAALAAQDAPLLLLDEPANHLDPAQQIATYKLIGELWREGRAVLCVTHDLNLLRFASPDASRVRVVGMSAGRIDFECALNAPELAASFAALFGVRVAVHGPGLLVAEDTA